MVYTADFETTTTENDCRVWAFAICDIKNFNDVIKGTSVDEFFDFAQCGEKNDTYYFHNLKFDGSFIMYWLRDNGFKWVADQKDLTTKTFTTLISDKDAWYQIKICFWKQGKAVSQMTILDSLKILPFSIEKIAEDFNTPITKLKIDYNEYRPIGHMLTEHESEYIENDVKIDAYALSILFEQKLDCMTQASNALKDFKEIFGKKNFERYFPPPSPEYDKSMRPCYKGGWTYLSPRFKNKKLGYGCVLDVNSLYPSVMRNCLLPYGESIYYSGKYEYDKLYPLYIQSLVCNFELKKDHVPTIQLKHTGKFCDTEYLTSSDGEDVALSLTSVDLKLFFEHYDVYNIEWIDGYKFKGKIGLFTKYIDKWSKIKIDSKKSHNRSMYTLAKLMLNALYGKFALNPVVRSKQPVFEENEIKYKLGQEKIRDGIYLPVGTFITAYARYKTITTAQRLYKYFIYADTDSLHLNCTPEQIPDDIEISDTILGYWKLESVYRKARFIRQKTYIEDEIITEKEYNEIKKRDEEKGEITPHYYKDGENYYHLKITCAGMPSKCYQNVTWENFQEGLSVEGKLHQKRCRGGMILTEGDYTIKYSI